MYVRTEHIVVSNNSTVRTYVRTYIAIMSRTGRIMSGRSTVHRDIPHVVYIKYYVATTCGGSPIHSPQASRSRFKPRSSKEKKVQGPLAHRSIINKFVSDVRIVTATTPHCSLASSLPFPSLPFAFSSALLDYISPCVCVSAVLKI